jgi:hypothetical protein
MLKIENKNKEFISCERIKNEILVTVFTKTPSKEGWETVSLFLTKKEAQSFAIGLLKASVNIKG